jgi:hypothetical protein
VVKNFSSGGIFLVTLFFTVEKRVTGSKGFESKNITDDGAKRSFSATGIRPVELNLLP